MLVPVLIVQELPQAAIKLETHTCTYMESKVGIALTIVASIPNDEVSLHLNSPQDGLIVHTSIHNHLKCAIQTP